MAPNIFYRGVKMFLIISSFSFFFLAVGMLIFPQFASAIGLIIPFGGNILVAVPCTNGLLITVGPPRPGVFLYQPGVSVIHENFILKPGAKVLGIAIPGGVCVLPVPIPAEGTIWKARVSLF